MCAPFVLSQLRSGFVVLCCRLNEEVNSDAPTHLSAIRVLMVQYKYSAGGDVFVPVRERDYFACQLPYPCLVPRHFPGTVIAHHHCNQPLGRSCSEELENTHKSRNCSTLERNKHVQCLGVLNADNL